MKRNAHGMVALVTHSSLCLKFTLLKTDDMSRLGGSGGKKQSRKQKGRFQSW